MPCLFFVFECCLNTTAQTPLIVTTIAGNGTSGSSGDGGPATLAALRKPSQLCMDGAGNIYFSDLGTNTVRKISTSGIITTVAGNGTIGFTGDSIPATATSLYAPGGIAIDMIGNLYIADNDNNRIRKVNTAGIITTIAGTGALRPVSGDGGPATAAVLKNPALLTLDRAGNLFFSSSFYSNIHKIDITSGIITMFAGAIVTPGYSGDGGPAISARISGIGGLVFDSSGNLYLTTMNGVRKIDTTDIITTIAGGPSAGGFGGDGGPATAAQFYNPSGIAIDRVGNMIIADYSNYRIRKINTPGIISTIAGNGTPGFIDYCPATSDEINSAAGMILDSKGNIYFADDLNHRIRKLSQDAAPGFTGGHSQSMTFCAGTYAVNTLLAARDSDLGQTETWSVVMAPAHGVLHASYTATSTGGILMPAGLYYLSATGYAGNDSFKVRITDCAGVSDTTTVHVAIMISPSAIAGASIICSGASTALTDSVAGGIWASSTTEIATISSTGMVTGGATGISTISYTIGGCTATSAAAVYPVPAAITGPEHICAGLSIMLMDTSPGGEWSSTDTAVASIASGVPSSGSVYGRAGGTTTISYTNIAGCAVTRLITVISVPPISGVVSICAFGSALPLYDSVTGGLWTSTLATVSPSGVVTPYSSGVATITYTTAFGCFATASVTINPLPGPISGSDRLCAGSTIALTDTASGGRWMSSNTAVAHVSSAGILSGLSAGIDTIDYILATGCMTAETITVDGFPIAGTITGSSVVCAGSSISLSDAATGGTWNSSSSAVAPVFSGTVSGISAGTAIVSYVVSNSCGSATAVKTITINPLPIAGAITGLSNVCTGDSIVLGDATTGGIWRSSGAGATIAGGVVSGISVSVDTINFSVTNSCGVAEATKMVTVNTLPNIGAITGMDTLCIGTTSALVDTAAGGTWTGSNDHINVTGTGTITAISPGLDTIFYAHTNTCGTATASFTVAVKTGPAAGTITGVAHLCIGAEDTLTDTQMGGEWSSSGMNVMITTTTTGVVITGVSQGADTIIYTTVNECGLAVAIFPIVVQTTVQCDSTSGVKNFPRLSGQEDVFRIWPNPSGGVFNVMLSSPNDMPLQLTVTNIVGEKVKVVNSITNKAIEIKLAGAPGIYFLAASTMQGNFVTRLVLTQ